MNKEYEVHQGLDYVVVLAPEGTTDNATARFREADVASKFVTAMNAHDALVKALVRAKILIATQMEEKGWPQEQIDNPPAGSHLDAINAALKKAGAL